jgi:hypothetical protein
MPDNFKPQGRNPERYFIEQFPSPEQLNILLSNEQQSLEMSYAGLWWSR